jgi:tripartite-type tricarboxylate transporter receptor subunit TctC
MEKEIRRGIFVNPNRLRTSLKGYSKPFWNILLSFIVFGYLGWSQQVQAQGYPVRPINMLVCFAAGAAVDVGARLIGQEAEKILGQEIVPINKPGGGGAVGAGILGGSKADGYTIMATVSATLTNVPHLESVTYDPLKDFIPIFQYGVLVPAFIVRSDSPHKSFNDLIEFSRKNPGKVSFATPGVGTSPDLAMQLVILEEKVNIATIPFGGSAPAITALLGGHVTVTGTSTPAAIPHLRAGKVRGMAITGDKRIEALPDVPTLLELGYPYGVFLELYMIAAPKGTPPAIVEKLEGAFRKAVESSEFRIKMRNLHMYPENPLFGRKLKEFIEQEYARNGEIIRKAKLGK